MSDNLFTGHIDVEWQTNRDGIAITLGDITYHLSEYRATGLAEALLSSVKAQRALEQAIALLKEELGHG